MYSSVCVFIGAKGTHVCMCVNVCQCASMSQSSHLALLPPVLVENDHGLPSSPSATDHQSKRK